MVKIVLNFLFIVLLFRWIFVLWKVMWVLVIFLVRMLRCEVGKRGCFLFVFRLLRKFSNFLFLVVSMCGFRLVKLESMKFIIFLSLCRCCIELVVRWVCEVVVMKGIWLFGLGCFRIESVRVLLCSLFFDNCDC